MHKTISFVGGDLFFQFVDFDGIGVKFKNDCVVELA